VATASYQIEGSRLADGGGESVWDAFARRPGAVLGGMNGDLACDSWRRWREDLALIRGLGVDAYRFSLSWARLLPDGAGRPNRAAIDGYRALIEGLLEAGVLPWATLYHWDHPQALEAAGGWPARDMALRFGDYAALCFREFGDLVAKWMTLNEPWCPSILGWDLGEHAPGHRDKQAAYRAVHHLLLGHGLAMEAWGEAGVQGAAPAGRPRPEPAIGIVINPSKPRPATRRPEDLLASERASDERTALWLDPLFGRGYPSRHLEAYPGLSMPIEAGDLDRIAAPLDFLGVNYYNEDLVEAAPVSPLHPEGYRYLPTADGRTEMDWAIVPAGLGRLLRFIDGRWKPRALLVTENGASFPDQVDSGGRIRDRQRIAYLRGHLAVCEDLVSEGLPLRGYFAWSLLDNFEWAWGYSRRFGLVHVDFKTLARRPKDSYYWFRDAVAGHGFRDPDFHASISG
jgi:beta-glucosidase